MPDTLEKAVNSGHAFASWIILRLGRRVPYERDSSARGGIGPQDGRVSSPHLLLFTWSFPPEVNGGVYRPVSLVKYAIKAGWQVTVVSGPLNGQETAAGIELANSLPAAAGVFRASLPPPTSYRLLPKID